MREIKRMLKPGGLASSCIKEKRSHKQMVKILLHLLQLYELRIANKILLFAISQPFDVILTNCQESFVKS